MENKKINPFLGILMLLPSMIVTIMILLMCMVGHLTVILFVFYYWLTVSATIAFIILFIISVIKRKNVWRKAVFYWGLFNILFLFVFFAFIRPQQTTSAEKMAKHYDKNKAKMEELHRYMMNAVDDSCYVYMRFKGNDIKKLYVKSADADKAIKLSDNNADSLLMLVGLDNDEVKSIRDRLKRVGCFAVMFSNEHPDKIELEYRDDGGEIYSYQIYNRPLTDDEKQNVMGFSEFIPYNDHVVFSLTGGFCGIRHFPLQEKDAFIEKHQPW